MDLESAQNNVVAKLPLLKQSDYEIWKLRIEQNNTLSLRLCSMGCLVTAEEKEQKNNNVKARSMQLMALPNEHLLTLSQYKDAKTLFKAIQARFDGNDSTKKTQKTLLKQIIYQEDLIMKFLRSLHAEWNTHVVVWRNKPDIKTMSFDNLYNNFKIVKQEVKRTVVSSSSSRSPNMAFLSSPSSTNEVNTASIQVSAVSTPVTNCKKITINGSDTVGYDKTKVECFNCHNMGHFAKERRSPGNQESSPRNQDSSRKTIIVEDTSSKAMVAIDGAGFDWSYLGDDEVPTNMALMAFSASEETSHFSRTIKNMMEDLLLLQGVLKEMCDKKNSVLFTETECFILSPDFKLPDENQVLLKVSRKNNMYSFDLKNVVPLKGLTYLFVKATNDESNLWYTRLGYINFKTMNKLVKENVVRGLPSKIFENDHTCVAYKKRKQHKASWIKREFNNVRTPQQNGVAERKNRTLIEAVRTILAVGAGNRTNGIAGSKIHSDVGQEGKEKVSDQEYILLPVLNTSSYVHSSNEEVKSSPKDDAVK
nr:ribonuclease H-like domain-containing protein [Tanacetum cinerariifolium]